MDKLAFANRPKQKPGWFARLHSRVPIEALRLSSEERFDLLLNFFSPLNFLARLKSHRFSKLKTT